jgi:hypothetical protein
MKNIPKYIRIAIYWFTKNRKMLDEYMRHLRRGKTISDGEAVKLKELIDHENKVYER